MRRTSCSDRIPPRARAILIIMKDYRLGFVVSKTDVKFVIFNYFLKITIVMMKIIHTSDLHLDPERPETLNALGYILETCRTHSVNMLTIGGDLFDSARDYILNLRERYTIPSKNILALVPMK